MTEVELGMINFAFTKSPTQEFIERELAEALAKELDKLFNNESEVTDGKSVPSMEQCGSGYTT